MLISPTADAAAAVRMDEWMAHPPRAAKVALLFPHLSLARNLQTFGISHVDGNFWRLLSPNSQR